MEYVVDGANFVFSYRDLKEEYRKFVSMTDEEFIDNLAAAAHLACFICYLKEIPSYLCLSDKGIIHELIHLIHIPEGNTTTLSDIRKLFEQQLKLS